MTDPIGEPTKLPPFVGGDRALTPEEIEIVKGAKV